MKDSITLIANSGLQFYHFTAEVPSNVQKESKFRFIEKFDIGRKRFWLDEVVCLSKDEDIWARKSELRQYGYISKSGKVSEELERSNLQLFDSTEFFEIGNASKVFSALEKKWIPLPYFYFNKILDEQFGPTDWVRLYFERTSETEIQCVLLVDTTVTSDPNDISSPYLHENANENTFSLCSHDELTISYLDQNFECEWVENYVSSFFNKPNTEIEKPYLKHAASYIYFIRLIRSLSVFPQINLLRNDIGIIDVDLVVDIGNSKTCAILFENPTGQQFHFNSVKKLEIQDFSEPMKRYDDSFSTRLVFKSTNFSHGHQDLNQNNKFNWYSPIRIGHEAEKTINHSNVELKLSRETRTTNSSPKRYLWDDKPADLEWEYHLDDPEMPFQRVYKKGVSEQLNSDGTFCTDGIFGTEARFSRKSLMTFVYLEIFSHAFRQINSIEFRSLHGNPSYRRKIRRIVISCPTAMIKSEQISLRQCAEDAIKILNNIKSYSEINPNNSKKDIYDSEVQVIPSVKELSLNEDSYDQRKEWIYDEASAAQMVYLYAMINDKFNGDAQKFFNSFNRTKKDEDTGKKNLRIASFDIGGGTSDLMITDYSLKDAQFVSLKPKPCYWESFKVAGDDLVEQLIQQVIIEGQPIEPHQKGACGAIEQELRKLGKSNVGAILNGFFGQDSNKIGYRAKLMRTNFVNQIAIPIVNEFLERASSDQETLSFAEIFSDNPPSAELLDYFESHFGFRFEQLKWTISGIRLKEICDLVYNRLFRQLGLILKAYQCDILILSGRPFSLKVMDELIGKFIHLTPNRRINLNTFWVGRWYPFADDNGHVEDPKTIVCVGSLIALMGGSLLKMGEFRLDTSALKTSLGSSANFIGKITDTTIEKVILSPDISEASFQVSSLPFQLGYKKVNSTKYPASVLYSLQIDETKVQDISKKKQGDDVEKLVNSAEDLKFRIRSKMPLKVSISRDFAENKEALHIEDVVDADGNDLSKAFFDLSQQTLSDPSGIWLDTGEFKLSKKF